MSGRFHNPNKQTIGCRICGCRMSTVTKTQVFEVSYNGKDRQVIKRSRKCRHCGFSYNTTEVLESEENTNLPEDITPFRQPRNPGVYCPPASIPDAGVGGVARPASDSSADTSKVQPGQLAASPLPPKKPQASKRRT